MYSHVMVGANSIEESKYFYDSVFAVLGYHSGEIDEKGRCFYTTKTGVFAITKPIDRGVATCGNGNTIGFVAKDIETVDLWHEIGHANGGSECEEPPGVRDNAFGPLYVAYLRDPAGNKICTVHPIN